MPLRTVAGMVLGTVAGMVLGSPGRVGAGMRAPRRPQTGQALHKIDLQFPLTHIHSSRACSKDEQGTRYMYQT